MRNADRPVLITGGTGFIGTYVARALADLGRKVCLFDIRGLSPEGRYILGDFADQAPVDIGGVEIWPQLMETIIRRQPTHIVHIGGIVDPLFLLKNPAVGLRVNVEGTVNVLEAARLTKVERVIYFSSIGVLPKIQYEPIDAAHPIILANGGPATGAYGAAKVAGEAFCFAYHQAFQLDVRIIRPSAAYGFGMQWHSANYLKQIVEPAVRGEKVRLPSGGPLPRDYVHVRDIAGLTLALLDAPDEVDRVFYAATGRPLTTAAQAARLVAELVTGADIQIGNVLSEADRLELDFRGVLSIENARRQLKWQPIYSSLKEGLGEYIDCYRRFLAVNRQSS
jgi:nucleoside-diphosphate-sugar epimerase